ncbi:unnamed protein product [Prunus armeniaca]|uniref:Uncharacterized protein n=1 Tax=Prunus armeniaca TaxID=36596 RepID=A0A6J5WZY6_PRUAR|nr:unnamed protein product [Prunus armeniaca]
MKPVPVRIISPLKACRGSHLNVMGAGLTRLMASPPPLELPLLESPPPSPSTTTTDHHINHPCLDLCFNVYRRDNPAKAEANHKYLKQLLPVAWSHNPLTTLKLICNLLDRRSGSITDAEAFYKAAFWLHHNHPKTLASNLLPIAAWFGYGGGMRDLVRILHRILAGQDEVDDEMMFAMADKVAVERYETDPNYRLLHELVSDIFAHCLNRDFQLLKKGMQMDDSINDESSSNKCFEITNAADWLDHRATFLLESVARKTPRAADEGGCGALKEDDCHIALNKPPECNRWGYDCKFDEDDCVSRIYLEELKATASKIENPAALLPHQIICYVNDEDLGQVAELQWNAMLGDMIKGTGTGKAKKKKKKKKKKNLNNSLAVCDVCPSRMSGFPIDVSVGLGLLVSELSEEQAWKGKVINFSRNPRLHCIPQGNSLKAKCDFLRRMDCPDLKGEVDIQKVFDLILQVAVHGNLKPEQMINKVFVITTYLHYDEAWAHPWQSDYEAIQNKFKEKGYGDVVPQIEFLDVIDSSYFENHKLVKWFLDTDGEIMERDPEQIMEAEISPLAYQSLVVVD